MSFSAKSDTVARLKAKKFAKMMNGKIGGFTKHSIPMAYRDPSVSKMQENLFLR